MLTLIRHPAGDAAAGLGLHLHMPECPFSHDTVQILFVANLSCLAQDSCNNYTIMKRKVLTIYVYLFQIKILMKTLINVIDYGRNTIARRRKKLRSFSSNDFILKHLRALLLRFLLMHLLLLIVLFFIIKYYYINSNYYLCVRTRLHSYVRLCFGMYKQFSWSFLCQSF